MSTFVKMSYFDIDINPSHLHCSHYRRQCLMCNVTCFSLLNVILHSQIMQFECYSVPVFGAICFVDVQDVTNLKCIVYFPRFRRWLALFKTNKAIHQLSSEGSFLKPAWRFNLWLAVVLCYTVKGTKTFTAMLCMLLDWCKYNSGVNTCISTDSNLFKLNSVGMPSFLFAAT